MNSSMYWRIRQSLHISEVDFAGLLGGMVRALHLDASSHSLLLNVAICKEARRQSRPSGQGKPGIRAVCGIAPLWALESSWEMICAFRFVDALENFILCGKWSASHSQEQWHHWSINPFSIAVCVIYKQVDCTLKGISSKLELSISNDPVWLKLLVPILQFLPFKKG